MFFEMDASKTADVVDRFLSRAEQNNTERGFTPSASEPAGDGDRARA